MLLYPSGLDFISAFFGCLYAGIIAIPVDLPRRNQGKSKIQAIVKDAEAKLVLTTKSELASLERKFNQKLELVAVQWLATDDIASSEISD